MMPSLVEAHSISSLFRDPCDYVGFPEIDYHIFHYLYVHAVLGWNVGFLAHAKDSIFINQLVSTLIPL